MDPFIVPCVLHSNCMCAKLLQSCLTLCDPKDCSPPGSSVHGILQARNTGVVCHACLQGIFPTQGPNQRLLCLLHWQAGSLPPGMPFTQCTVIQFALVLYYCVSG